MGMEDSHEKAEFARRLNAICDEKELPPPERGRQPALAKQFGVTPKAPIRVTFGT